MASLSYFTIRLIFGIALMLGIMPRRDVATAFFRIEMLLLLGLSVLLVLATPGVKFVPIALAAMSYVGFVFWKLERRSGGSIVILLLALLSIVELFLSTGRLAVSETSTASVWTLASAFATSAVLGATMTGMLLGHRYLTAPGMPLAPLVRMNQYLGIAAGLRLALSAAMLVLIKEQTLTSTAWTWLGLRWLAGIVGPLVVCAMVWRILNYRNTQSATGVLFVGVILSFIGELTGDLLFHELHVPL